MAPGILMGFDLLDSAYPAVPYINIRNVVIRFPGYRVPGSTTSDTPTYYAGDYINDPVSSLIDYSLPVADSCRAYFDGSSPDPVNQANLDTLASAVGFGLMEWKKYTFDVVYNGIVTPSQSGYFDTVEFSYLEDDSNTRVYSYPFNFEPQQMNHWDWSTGQASGNGPNNRFISPSTGIPRLSSAVCMTSRLNTSGTWTDCGTAVVWNPSINNDFAGSTQGTFVVDQYGNFLAVQEDCPASTASG